MPAEQAADFAALAAAASVEAAPLPGAPVEPERPALADEIKALTLAFVGMAAPILPSLAKIYTEETTTAAAQAVAAVCEKHGWLSAGLMGDYGEEIAAAVVLLPIGFATVQGVRGDLAAMRKKPEAEPATLPAATVSDTGVVNQNRVVFGAPIPDAPVPEPGAE